MEDIEGGEWTVNKAEWAMTVREVQTSAFMEVMSHSYLQGQREFQGDGTLRATSQGGKV